MKFGVYAGTVGTSMWVSEDGGEEWIRPYDNAGLYLECCVYALGSRPHLGKNILLGTDLGLYRWLGPERKWEHIPSVLDGIPVWAVEQSPHDPEVLIAGTRTAALYRSEDGGKTWSRLAAELAKTCIFVDTTRVTQILFDPVDKNLVWAGVEIDGVWRSRDGGRTWSKCCRDMVSEDVHGLCAVYENGKRKLFASTNKGLFVSTDDGETWTQLPLESDWQYTRTIVQRADDTGVMFVTNGNGPPGSTGRLFRSDDYGSTWRESKLPTAPNSTLWRVATHPAAPELIYVCSNFGQIWKSENGGDSWVKLKREFGEIRSLLLRPLE
jgi:photosystem II stability/assembly factor-like uncharacterized protein